MDGDSQLVQETPAPYPPTSVGALLLRNTDQRQLTLAVFVRGKPAECQRSSLVWILPVVLWAQSCRLLQFVVASPTLSPMSTVQER